MAPVICTLTRCTADGPSLWISIDPSQHNLNHGHSAVLCMMSSCQARCTIDRLLLRSEGALTTA
jgi:hypothetical protein